MPKEEIQMRIYNCDDGNCIGVWIPFSDKDENEDKKKDKESE